MLLAILFLSLASDMAAYGIVFDQSLSLSPFQTFWRHLQVKQCITQT